MIIHDMCRDGLLQALLMRMCLFVICLSLPYALHADKLSSLYSILNIKLNDPLLLKDAVTKGKERAFLCVYCHGSDGNSKRGYIPNLADQNNKYLLRQFEMFSSKQRNNRIMSELAKNLDDDDRVNIALFYSTQKVKSGSASRPELLSAGKKLFISRCSSCHGDNGHGKEMLPRIAGQPVGYLKKTLNSYRNNPDMRPNSPMQGIAPALNKSDQAAVIEYISIME